MGLAAIFQRAAAVAFTVGGDVKKTVIIYAGPTFAHDTTNDTTATTWATTKETQAFVYAGKESKKDAEAETKRRACLLQGSEFAGIEITQECEADAEGFRWKIASVEPDPVSATIELQLYR